MKKYKRTIVDIQKTRVEEGNEDSFEKYLDINGECYLSNPDLLPEQETGATSPQLLIGEAVEHLQGRQKEVYLLHMRCDQSLEEVAEVLGISRGTAQTYLKRAVGFVESYCHRAILRGRV